ncbi:MAG: FMN-binding protein [Phycicoccus sp.]|nr:FMN-binding protein [Phycicoccus sp.]NMM32777.1 FMN-binding protein [Phycicoccus sp.]
MRRIVTTILSTISILVLLFSYHTSSSSAGLSASPVVQQPAGAGSASQSRSSTRNGSSTSASSSTKKSGAATQTATYTGQAADTRWGPVQVQLTVQGGKITRSRAVQYPQGTNVDAQINGYALPILDQEVVQKQSASIDTISGATVTSDGYLQSLQSAIDQAHL